MDARRLADVLRGNGMDRGVEARFAFLAAASRLLADSLDYETTLVTVARLALPHLGAWGMVDLIEPDGSIRRLAIIHADSSKRPQTRELHMRHPPGPGDVMGATRVMHPAESEVVLDATDVARSLALRDPEHAALLGELGFGGFLTVPMVARGRMVGALTFVTTHPGEHDLGPSDLMLVEDLAERCAMVIDSARLYVAGRACREVADRALAKERAATQETGEVKELLAAALIRERELMGDAHMAARKTTEVAERLVIAAIQGQELTEEAREANRAKTEFLETMSHEARTPIHAIMGYTDLLCLGIPSPPTEGQLEHLDRIRANSDHLLMLIDDILDLAKVEAGRVTVRREESSAASAIAASLVMVLTQAAMKGVDLEDLGADGEGPSYVGDERRVQQILVNLLSNAVKFTPPGGRVTVSSGDGGSPDPAAQPGTEGRWTWIGVEDTGIGIAPDQTEAVFAPFVQVASGEIRTHGGGGGLGLTISRELAARMGGRLTLRSELGVGSRFTLWLPATDSASS